MLPLEIVEKIIQYTDDILLYISLEFDNQHYINKFTKNYILSEAIKYKNYYVLSKLKDIPYNIAIFFAIESGDLNAIKYIKDNWSHDRNNYKFEATLAAFRLYKDIYEYIGYNLHSRYSVDLGYIYVTNMYIIYDDISYLDKRIDRIHEYNKFPSENTCKLLLDSYKKFSYHYYEVVNICCAANYITLLNTIINEIDTSTFMFAAAIQHDNLDIFNILLQKYNNSSTIRSYVITNHYDLADTFSGFKDELLDIDGEYYDLDYTFLLEHYQPKSIMKSHNYQLYKRRVDIKPIPSLDCKIFRDEGQWLSSRQIVEDNLLYVYNKLIRMHNI